MDHIGENSEGFIRTDVLQLEEGENRRTNITCKRISIGTHRFQPNEDVVFTSKGIRMVAPTYSQPTKQVVLNIHTTEVVKIIAHFSEDQNSMLCLYTLRACAMYIKNSLNLPDSDGTKNNPVGFSANGPYQTRKIILQFTAIPPADIRSIKEIWEFFDEISYVDAQDLLGRNAMLDSPDAAQNNNGNSQNESTVLDPNDVRQLLIYPPGKGGIAIHTEDYMCLATDQYLNDIIIDFYLKWLHLNVVPKDLKEKTYIFSTFFYKRLTRPTKQANQEKDVKQTAAQKRHARVQNWTKNVNLFDKDFIIIPINEQSHWFLAIICFPGLKGPVTYDTLVPVAPQALKKQKNKKVAVQIGKTTITTVCKRNDNTDVSSAPLSEPLIGDVESERDEAEGEESDLASDDSDLDNLSVKAKDKGNTLAIKQPLILIFDSLAGASRSRVVATLRDYLTCEYKAKMLDPNIVNPHVFNKDSMLGHCVKVPQQNNFTDCGLFLLQYVEMFFKDPIKDYQTPIKQLNNWFETIVVTRKREEISQLLQKLMDEKNGQSQIILPKIPFPTLNGEIVEQEDSFADENIDFEEEELEDECEEEDDTQTICTTETSSSALLTHSTGTSGAPVYDEIPNSASSSDGYEIGLNTSTVTMGKKIVMKRRIPISAAQTQSKATNANAMVTSNAGSGLKIRKLQP